MRQDEAFAHSRNRDIFLLFLAVLLPQITYIAISSVAVTASESYFQNESAASSITTVFLFGYALTMPISGILAEKMDARVLIFLALSLGGSIMFIPIIFHAWPVFLTSRFIYGLTGGSTSLLTRVFIKRVFVEKHYINALSYTSAAVALGSCIAPILGEALSSALGVKTLMVSLALLNLVTGILCFFLLSYEPKEIRDAISVREFSAVSKETLKNKNFLKVTSYVVLAGVSYIFILATGAYQFKAENYSELAYSIVISLSSIGFTIGSRFSHRLIAKFDKELSCLLVAIMGLSGALLITFNKVFPNLLLLTIATLAVFTCAGIIFPICQTDLLRLPIKRPAIAIALFFFIEIGSAAIYGSIIGPFFLGGFLWLGIGCIIPASMLFILTTANYQKRIRKTNG